MNYIHVIELLNKMEHKVVFAKIAVYQPEERALD